MYFVYIFYDINDKVIYVGQTKRKLEERIKEHFGPFGHLPRNCYQQTNKITYHVFYSKKEMDLAEAYLIKKYLPCYNKKIENISNIEKNSIKKLLNNEMTYKGDLLCQVSLHQQKQKTLISQMFLKLKNMLKNLKQKI